MATDIGKVDMSTISTVGEKSLATQQLGNLRINQHGALITQNLFGRYEELAAKGYIFSAKSGAAAAIPIQSTLTNAPTLWNPASSGKWVIPLYATFSPGAVGTPVLTGLTVSYLLATGDTVATNLPFATFTNIVPVCMTLQTTLPVAQTKFANAAVTFTTNPALLMDLGMVHWLEGTAAFGGMQSTVADFQGALLMKPGTAISIGAIAATSTTYWTTIVFAEFQAPPA